MWETAEFWTLSGVAALTLFIRASSFTQFIFYSELLWVLIYAAVSGVGGTVMLPYIASLPFIILVLTAVEAVIAWTVVSGLRDRTVLS